MIAIKKIERNERKRSLWKVIVNKIFFSNRINSVLNLVNLLILPNLDMNKIERK